MLALLAATALTLAAPAVASAQSIGERQVSLDQRIDAGIRSGQLTSTEAAQLRAEFNDLLRLESRYRRDGLSAAERDDLDRRFDMLSQRIRVERRDGQDRGDRYDRDRGDGERVGGNINQRERDIEARIEAGVRNRTLTRYEAAELRNELDALERIEADYRASGRGLSPVEREYLDRRLDLLERRLRVERQDDDRRWSRLDARQAAFDQQLDQAVRDRRLSPSAAANLRAEFRATARLERQYRANGITPAERAELNRRLDRMEANLRATTAPTPNLFDLLFGIVGGQQPR
jgi:chaperonin cofactor prefoldin